MVSRVAPYRVLEISETACLADLTRPRQLKRMLIASDPEDPVENMEAHCLVNTSSVKIAASAFVCHEMDVLCFSPSKKRAIKEQATMYACWRDWRRCSLDCSFSVLLCQLRARGSC